MSDEEFSKFLTGMIARSGLERDQIEKIIRPNLEKFREAFTHPTYDDVHNFEILEFAGDKVVNMIASRYIRKRFPYIAKEGWLTKTMAYLSDKKMLGRICEQEGLTKYIRYGPEMAEIIKREKDPHNDDNYIKMLEDVVEAFCGALVEAIEDQVNFGVAMIVVERMLFTFYDQMDIDLNKVWDSVSLIKELYEYEAVLGKDNKWPFGKGRCYDVHVEKKENLGKEECIYTVTFWGWPLGDKKPIPKNQKELSRVTDTNESRAIESAATRALEVLRSLYGIYKMMLDKYDRRVRRTLKAK